MSSVTINGKTYGLRFDLGALETVEQEFGDLKNCFEQLRNGTDRINVIKRMFVIMANCQRAYEGKPEDVTMDALKHAPIWALAPLGEAITQSWKESMNVETANGGVADDAVHDAYLEEIEAKNAPTGD